MRRQRVGQYGAAVTTRSERTFAIRTPVGAIVLVALAAVLAACGAASSASSRGPIVSDHDTADQARAEAMLLTVDDLPPAGWTGTPWKRSSFQITRCIPMGDLTEKGDAHSDNFDRGPARITSHATVYGGAAEATAAMQRLRAPGVLDCATAALNTELKKHAEPGVTFDRLKIAPLDVPAAGDESSGLRITTTVYTQGQTLQLYSDGVFVRVGDAVSTLGFTNLPTPIDPATRSHLVDVVAGRMAASQ